MTEYKLYVWNGSGILQDYTPGMVVSLARTKKEAIENALNEFDRSVDALEKKIINSENSWQYSDFGTVYKYKRSDFY